MDCKALAQKLADYTIEMRREFHMHPEMPLEEKWTIIFAARNTYFKRKVFICCLYSEGSKESILNNKNRLYESIII